MSNLLKRNSAGGIERICHYSKDVRSPDSIQCFGCSYRTKCNGDIFDKLARYEETGIEPEYITSLINRKMITEWCIECDFVTEMVWDVGTDGYKAFCPMCGARLMLCDVCQHRKNGEYTDDCDYNTMTDTCRFNRKEEKNDS